ncbi:MAG: hypothetical protein ACOX88_02485 [Christensenellales bacterium]|jgi:hypothetical protein
MGMFTAIPITVPRGRAAVNDGRTGAAGGKRLRERLKVLAVNTGFVKQKYARVYERMIKARQWARFGLSKKSFWGYEGVKAPSF